jgi:ribosomal protein L7/L12
MLSRIAKSVCHAGIKRQPQFTSQWRAFTPSAMSNNLQNQPAPPAANTTQEQPPSTTKEDAAAGVTETPLTSTEYTFKYPRSKEIYEKMIQLQLDEIRLVTELINEKLGIKITEADKRGFQGAVDNGGDTEDAGDAQETVKKTAFDLKLTGFDDKSKIKIIKEVRAITGLGLKEAKEMVEGVPKTLKKQIKMEEAEELKAKLGALGATVEID